MILDDLPSIDAIAHRIGDYRPDALSVAQAQDFIARFVRLNLTIEKVAIRSALGRVLANDIVSPIDVPAHDNSAMDGYAVRASDLPRDELASGIHRKAPITLDVIGTAFAGSVFPAPVAPGQCIRVMTGAVMPAGCDTVVPQEICKLEGLRVSFPAGIHAGENRRLRGEDLATGQAALQAGRVLKPADLGLLASLGIGEIPVRRKLRVAFFSTGDELRSIGEPLEPGCIYDSNRYTLHAMLTRLGVDFIDLGVVRDDPVVLERTFRHAAADADAIVTSGGVSVGEADHTKQIMAKLGDVAFWTIAMRPGRPMAFGRIWAQDRAVRAKAPAARSAVVFGLPGNPVAVMVTFYHFVRSALLAMQGASTAPLPLMKVRCLTAVRKKPGRTEYQRGILEPAADQHGETVVRLTGQQGSGVLRSMSEANCFVVLHHDLGDVAAGDWVDVMLFDGLV